MLSNKDWHDVDKPDQISDSTSTNPQFNLLLHLCNLAKRCQPMMLQEREAASARASSKTPALSADKPTISRSSLATRADLASEDHPESQERRSMSDHKSASAGSADLKPSKGGLTPCADNPTHPLVEG